MGLQTKIIANLIALSMGTFLALLLSEILLHFYFGTNNLFYVQMPNISEEFQLPSDLITGIQGRSRFTTNQQGMRGEDYPAAPNSYRILAMGGSTTICSLLGDLETWPALIQEKLKKTADGKTVWVANIGKNGLTTRSHVLQMYYLVPQYPVDLILVMIGINDLSMRLWDHENYNPNFMKNIGSRNTLMFSTFSIVPDSQIYPLYKRLGLWKLARRMKVYFGNQFNLDAISENFLQWRLNRQNGRKINFLPDLTSALEEYTLNITEIVELAKKDDIRLIFLTQPVLWHNKMTKEEKEALIIGFLGDPFAQKGPTYYNAEALAEGMKLYNIKLKQICQQLNVECIDLTSEIPQNLQVFYDDCHFTELGAELVANVVVGHLENKPTFLMNSLVEQ